MIIHTTSITHCSGETYRFCWDKAIPKEVAMRIPPKKLRDKIQSVVHQIHDIEEYPRFRGKYCALNRALTHHGWIPPRFRPTVRSQISFRSNPTQAQMLLVNDHQIIDLEWISANCNDHDQITSELPFNFKSVIPSSELGLKDYLIPEDAERFVGTGGSLRKKAEEYLNLSPEDQLCLRTIQGEEIRNTWRNLSAKRDVIEKKLRRNSLKGKEKSWANAWPAGELSKYGYDASYWYEVITADDIAASSITYIRKKIAEAE